MSVSAQRPPSRSSDLGAAYPNGSAPRTPLEYRHGPHPKKVSSARKAKGATPSLRSAAIALQDFLLWKTPPSRQLSREKRREFECDVQERFYDDYIGVRNSEYNHTRCVPGSPGNQRFCVVVGHILSCVFHLFEMKRKKPTKFAKNTRLNICAIFIFLFSLISWGRQ